MMLSATPLLTDLYYSLCLNIHYIRRVIERDYFIGDFLLFITFWVLIRRDANTILPVVDDLTAKAGSAESHKINL